MHFLVSVVKIVIAPMLYSWEMHGIVLCHRLALPLTSRPDGGLPPPQGPWCALTNASEDDKDLPGKDECGHRDWWQGQYAPTHHSRTLVLQWDLIYLTLVVVANSAAAVF